MKTSKSKKSTLKHLTLKLGVNENAKYTTEDLVDILGSISFELININLNTKKSHLGLNGMGYSPVGFVNSFNSEDKTFEVVVFENRVESIEQLGEVNVIARAFTNKEGVITKVIGLDVEPVAVVE